MRQQHKKTDKIKTKKPVLILHADVLLQILNTVGNFPAETGGAMGGNDGGREITHFHFDKKSNNSGVTYSPDHKTLNNLFQEQWNPAGIRLHGFIHSHPGLMNRPSLGDEIYAEKILKAIKDLDRLWLPIINTVPGKGLFKMTPWTVTLTDKGVRVVRGKIKVIQPPIQSSLTPAIESPIEGVEYDTLLDEIVIRKKSHTDQVGHIPIDPMLEVNLGATFNRVQDAYDLNLMRNSRIIAIGAGGAASWLEDLARTGLGQFVLIDPDVVSETNLATQQTYRRDIGRPKVDCIAERIHDINPNAKIIAIQKSLDDLQDKEMHQLALDVIHGAETKRTLICGLTDSFFAQARVNRLGLQLELPTLCAQVYKEGRGAEITFTYPGVTPACHRCILSSRYRHFLEKGLSNDVTSHGTPIFSTARLNALKGFIALAIFHHGSQHPRWGTMLSRIGKRNLIQIRLDPDFSATVGIGIFDKVFKKADHRRIFFDEVIWLPQDQEGLETGYAPCPDCGGTGDLRDAFGKFEDTKILVKAFNNPPEENVEANIESDKHSHLKKVRGQ